MFHSLKVRRINDEMRNAVLETFCWIRFAQLTYQSIYKLLIWFCFLQTIGIKYDVSSKLLQRYMQRFKKLCISSTI